MSRMGLLGVAVLLLTLLPGCSDDGLTVPHTPTVLHILSGTVQIAADGADFEAASDGMALGSGDTVRTGADGRAAIEWFDGSITRLDHDTSFTIDPFGLDGDATVIAGTQRSGNAYHVVREFVASGSRFEMSTPTAIAAVQGTEYAVFVEPDGSTLVAVVDAAVSVEALGGSVTVDSGLSLEVPRAAASFDELGEPVPIPQEVLDGEWLTYNEPRPPAFFEAAADRDFVGLAFYPIGVEVSVAIYDQQGGELLDEGTVITRGLEDQDDFYESVVDIVPGQYITVTVGGTERDTVVVPLTFDLFDREAQVLEGTAAPGATVVAFIEVAPSNLIEVIVTTADAEGDWSISFAGFDVQPHHFASVRVEDDDGDTTLAFPPEEG